MMSVTLVSVHEGDEWVPGFAAGRMKEAFFMRDTTVRAWLVARRAEDGDVIVADEEWTNHGGLESLMVPVGPHDLAMVERNRQRTVTGRGRGRGPEHGVT